jgi:predicted enzyme related to lactoylglutathione lyase
MPVGSSNLRDACVGKQAGSGSELALDPIDIFGKKESCMADANHRGEFVWHDLMTPNSAGAHEFYGKLLGWKPQTWDKDPSYVMFAARSGPVGGAVESRTISPHWLPYISTSGVDDTVAAATRLGAHIVTAAAPLPNGGRYAVLADPQGAAFGVYASADAAEEAAAPQPGDFSWHELATSVAPSIAFGFYAALFDWDEMQQYDMGPMGMYLIFGRNGRQLGGMFDKGAQGKPGAAYWLGYVSVTDLEGTVERAKASRGSVLVAPMDVPGGDRIAQLMDPYGAFIALHKPAGQAAPAETAKAAASKPAKKAAAPKPAAKKPAAKKPTAKKKAAAKRAKPTARKPAKRKPAAKKKAARKPAKGKPKKKTAKKAKKRGR